MPKGIPTNGVNKGWYKKGQSSPNKGKVASLETLKKMRISRLGRKVKMTDEWKRNLSLSLKGKPKPWLRGKTRIITDEWRKNMSIAHRFEDRSLLKKSDRQNSGAYLEWSNAVKKRDGHQCKIANKDCNGNIESHHILSWREHSELRYEVNNGITLCRFHHPLKYLEEERLSPYFINLVTQK